MSKRIPHKRIAIMAVAAGAFLAAPWASTTVRRTAAPDRGTSATTPGSDTAYNRPYWDSTAGGTGMGTLPGRGGSSVDSAFGRDTLWSSPSEGPSTPGTGLPNSQGSGLPGTGSPGSSGNGGSGTGGSGIYGDSANGTPGDPSVPGKVSPAPHDSIGAPDWMERG